MRVFSLVCSSLQLDVVFAICLSAFDVFLDVSLVYQRVYM